MMVLLYGVIKGTIGVISHNYSRELIIENALSAGFEESEIEILTQEEFEERKALEPIPPQPPSEIELLRNKITEQERTMEELMFVIIPDILGGGM